MKKRIRSVIKSMLIVWKRPELVDYLIHLNPELTTRRGLVEMATPLLTIPFTKQSDLVKFVSLVRDYANIDDLDGQFIRDAIDGKLGKISDDQRAVALYVSGQKLIEGPLSDMKLRFKQEVDGHSGNVELREMRDGKWITIQSRRNN